MAAFDLCDLSDVRAFLQKPTADVAQDAVVQSFITAASSAILNYTSREFAPSSAAGTVRTFEIDPAGFLQFTPWDLQAATLVQIDTDRTPLTLTAPLDYAFTPVGKPDGVYCALRIVRRIAGGYTWNRQLQITGTWGFPQVPDDVRQATAITAGLWIRRDVSAFTTTYNLDQGTVERPEAIPSSARAMLKAYCRPLVA